jgi:hypothetical protein
MQRKHKRTIAVIFGTSPTKERRQHNGGLIMERVAKGMKGRRVVNRYRAAWECPLDIYRARKLITGAEYQAGLRFRQAFHQAVLSRSAQIERWQPYTHTNMEPTMSERLINEAYEVLGNEERDAVTTVCGYGGVIWNPAAYEKFKKGLGHLSVRWIGTTVEVCETKRKDKKSEWG